MENSRCGLNSSMEDRINPIHTSLGSTHQKDKELLSQLSPLSLSKLVKLLPSGYAITPLHMSSVESLSLWCGGANPQRLPYLKWEKNGDPGLDLGRLLVHVFMYPHYFVTKTLGTVVEKIQGTKGEMQKYGYQMTRDGKSLLLRAYERALKSGRIINHCKFSLEQAKQYIYCDDGRVEPAELVEATVSERKLHGDRVIADALTVEDEDVSDAKQTKVVTPFNSWGGRFDSWKRKKKNKKRNSWSKRYDYTKRV